MVRAGLILGMVLLAGSLQAESDPERPPGVREGGPGEKRFKEMRALGNKRNPMPFKPFLMAGTPQFTQMLKMALLPPDQVEVGMQQWPKYQEMDEMAREELRRNLERFRHRIKQEAMEDAQQQRLVIPPGQEGEFVRLYWEKRIQIETRVRQEAETRMKQEMDAIWGELRQRYTSP